MTQQIKTIQDRMKELRLKDVKKAQFDYRLNQFWTLCKRLGLVLSLGYGVYWARQPENKQTLKSFLKSASAPVEQRVGNFKEGMGMIQETFKENRSNTAYHEQRQKQIKEYKEVGIDPTIKYAEAGTKEFRDELEYYRKAGVFDRD